MNTNQLKKFAKEARIKLITQIGVKLDFVLTQDTAELRGKSSELAQLRSRLSELGREQLIETVAYTWFNRLMALRFMDANGYNTPKVVTPLPGMSNPEILQNALAGNVEEDLKLDRQRLNDLIDGRTSSSDAQTEAFKLLLVASCNKWHTAMPFMFERISDYTELLLPDDLLSDFSIVSDIRNGMSDEDCQHEELIGWLYQFYISDKKDDVFEGLKKNIKITAENIPAATQLFTPRWIVRYMVENTLGKLWLTFKPESKLKQHMPYFLEAPEGNNPSQLPEGINSITDITFLDPCQGSGHVLVYAFDLLCKIYEEEGYNTNEIPSLILENNLFGIDIDERAAQLAAFALTMKARGYYTRFLRKPIQPKVIALENINENIIKDAVKLPLAVDGKLIYDHRDLTLYNLTQADNLGSLIQVDPKELNALQIQKGSIWQDQEHKIKIQAEFLSKSYSCVVTNPPFAGSRNMNDNLKNWLDSNYFHGSNDLFAAFVIRCANFTAQNGLTGLITLHGWMFISTFNNFRNWLLDNMQINTLLHIGGNSFPSMNSQIARAVTFTFGQIKKNNLPKTLCFDLDSIKNSHSVNKEELFKEKLKRKEFIFKNFKDFKLIDSSTILYSISDNLLKIFINNKTIGQIAKPRQGLATGDNNRFVRFWSEVSLNKQYISSSNKPKWFTYNKGGDFRKWYGNNQFVINWENDGFEIKNNFDQRGKLRSRPQNSSFYFKEGLTYSLIGNTSFCARKYFEGHLFDVGGSGLFVEKDLELLILGLVNSAMGTYLLSKLNPTINFQVGDISNIPIVIPEISIKERIELIVKENIEISRIESSFFEENFEFNGANILSVENKNCNQYIIGLVQFAVSQINKMYKNEVELNKMFSKIYEISDENILSENYSINLFGLWKSNSGSIEINELILKNAFVNNLISFGIGCIFGRYSLDKAGLVLADQGQTFDDFVNQFTSITFKPDEDNIIPVLDGEWFSDDVVNRFKEFIKCSFSEDILEENLRFIEETINKDIRKYFVKDFYNDHIKRYKKRPIYWMFSSPKGHFKALIYMHRYQPDLCSKLLNDYLQPFISKLEAAKQTNTLLSLREDVSAREKTLALKDVDRLELMIRDCKDYERTLFTVATQKIAIDLDDGVKVNYLKFKDVLVPIKGLEKEED